MYDRKKHIELLTAMYKARREHCRLLSHHYHDYFRECKVSRPVSWEVLKEAGEAFFAAKRALTEYAQQYGREGESSIRPQVMPDLGQKSIMSAVQSDRNKNKAGDR